MSADISASVRGRLLNQARLGGEEFERTLVRYAAERFLYRLGASPARDRCLLKGAPAQFASIGKRIIEFIGPVDANARAGDSWLGTWRKGGPWSQLDTKETR